MILDSAQSFVFGMFDRISSFKSFLKHIAKFFKFEQINQNETCQKMHQKPYYDHSLQKSTHKIRHLAAFTEIDNS